MRKYHCIFYLLVLLFGCAGERAVYMRDAVPRAEPLSKSGNPDSYVQNGRRYFVLPTARGYRERGIASWYGRKFHGRRTSSGEKYNMYAMTAAHKTLPLPSYVRVTNLKNRRSVVLRVNDRGPFVDNRIIDVSYSAAEKLGMVRDGTALVEVVVVEPGAGRVVRKVQPRYESATDWRDESHLQNRIFIQVGAYSSRQNAEKIVARLVGANVAAVRIQQSSEQGLILHRVRVGPLHTVSATDRLVADLANLGFNDSQIVIE